MTSSSSHRPSETVADKPRRVQLRRTLGWRMPPNTVKVDRSSRWGNPFTMCERDVSLRLFKSLVDGVWDPGNIPPDTPDAMWDHLYGCYQTGMSCIGCGCHPRESIRRDLRGKNLACWCKPSEPCHADILMEIANG